MEIWLIQGINSLRRTCRKWNSVYIELKFTTYKFLQCVFQSLQTLPLCVPYTVKWLALQNGKGQASDTNYKGAHTKSEYGQFTQYTRVTISTHTNPCHKAHEVKLVSLYLMKTMAFSRDQLWFLCLCVYCDCGGQGHFKTVSITQQWKPLMVLRLIE